MKLQPEAGVGRGAILLIDAKFPGPSNFGGKVPSRGCTPVLRSSVQQDVCLFPHYDAHGQIASHVLHYVSELQAAGFDIGFISTTDLREVKRAIERYTDVIVRPNRGYDFSSWINAYAKATALLLFATTASMDRSGLSVGHCSSSRQKRTSTA